jgi:acylphosphatase
VSLGLAGWVRNVADGGVEILAEGDSANIAAFIDWCRLGPRWARVDELKLADETPAGALTGFDVVTNI